MDYKNFGLIDFILDDSFQEWVLNPIPDADKFWQDWIRQNPEKKSIIQKARTLMLNIDFEGIAPEEFNKDKVFQNINAIIKTGELTDELNISRENEEFQPDDEVSETIIYSLPSTNIRKKIWYKVAIAAAASLFIILGVWGIFTPDRTIHYSTQFGETKSFTLPDGSSVVLNANSTISYNQDWQSTNDREIDLTGEAFFSVVHTEDNQKFIVHSNGVAIEVLGTEFNVNNRRGKTQVVLKSGKVMVNFTKGQIHHPSEDGLSMNPGDLVEVSEKDQKITKRVVNPEKYASWTNGVLIFDNVPLSEVFEMIQDIYGYDVTVEDEGIEHKIFEAEISSKDIDLITTILSRSFNLEIKKEGNELVVKKRM